ncbi:MAG: hypothetical protein ABJE66_20795 [Deltaproteobacteria bacterium]
MKKLIGVAIVVVLVAVNPVFRMFVHDYSYSETDIRHAVEGAWTVTPEHGAAIHFTATERSMHAAREGLIRSAGACGERSFVHTAGACMDFSTLDLAITSTDITVEQATFRVIGLDFERGDLELLGGIKLRLRAQVAPDGRVSNVELTVDGHVVPATLARM